jgi:hypothetical protein
MFHDRQAHRRSNLPCAWHNEGELSAIDELKRRFPLITDHANASMCVQAMLSWAPRPAGEELPNPGTLK